MSRPAFSVCIPNYNYEAYIGETIESVLRQTYQDFEIVVVDNASTDRSVEVVKAIRSDRIRQFRNEYNVGFAPNLDRAVSHAANPFIIVLSSDDLMHPTALEEYARALERLGGAAEHTLLVSACDVIDGKGAKTGLHDRAFFFDVRPDETLTARLGDPAIQGFAGRAVFKDTYPRMHVPGPFCSTCYSRTLYDRVGGYSSVNLIGPDAHFAYKALLQQAAVIFIDRPLFSYRMHATNQLAQDRSRLTIRVAIDRYLFSIQYSDEELASAGVGRHEMAQFLIDTTCLKGALHELRAGSRYQAFRLFMFAFASYPWQALKNFKAYATLLLLLAGPIGPPLARVVFAVRERVLQSRMGPPE